MERISAEHFSLILFIKTEGADLKKKMALLNNILTDTNDVVVSRSDGKSKKDIENITKLREPTISFIDKIINNNEVRDAEIISYCKTYAILWENYNKEAELGNAHKNNPYYTHYQNVKSIIKENSPPSNIITSIISSVLNKIFPQKNR